MSNGYIAFVLTDRSRTELIKQINPGFPDVIAHHVTIHFGVEKPSIEQLGWLEKTIQTVQVIGYAKGQNIDTVIVAINGKTVRNDGKVFHITLSLDRSTGAKPSHSNSLLKNQAWTNVTPFTLDGNVNFISNH